MDESDINKMLEALKKSCPDIYEKLIDARRQQAFALDEGDQEGNRRDWFCSW